MSGIPRITVIVAAKNRAATLERCLRSVPLQAELIVVDGGSDDGSVDILRRSASRLAWWCSEDDAGICAAWNKAVAHASGEWILFLGADDWISDAEAWQKVAARLADVPREIRIAYGPVALVAASGREIAVVGEPWDRAGRRFRREMSLPHQGVFHRRTLFPEHGGFDESYRIAGDYEFLLRELPTRPAAFLGPDAVVATMTVGGLSTRGTNILQHLREIRRAQERHGVFAFSPGYVARWLKAAVREAGNRLVGPTLAGRLADHLRAATGRPRLWSVR
jgi:glycosyltransferase involved in cell wall biosynthesis